MPKSNSHRSLSNTITSKESTPEAQSNIPNHAALAKVLEDLTSANTEVIRSGHAELLRASSLAERSRLLLVILLDAAITAVPSDKPIATVNLGPFTISISFPALCIALIGMTLYFAYSFRELAGLDEKGWHAATKLKTDWVDSYRDISQTSLDRDWEETKKIGSLGAEFRAESEGLRVQHERGTVDTDELNKKIGELEEKYTRLGLPFLNEAGNVWRETQVKDVQEFQRLSNLIIEAHKRYLSSHLDVYRKEARLIWWVVKVPLWASIAFSILLSIRIATYYLFPQLPTLIHALI
jgi:hypothetical protein